jgi:hypothetical protein
MVTPLLEQEFSWRQEMLKSSKVGLDLRNDQVRALASAATVQMNLNKIHEAKCYVVLFFGTCSGGRFQSSIYP